MDLRNNGRFRIGPRPAVRLQVDGPGGGGGIDYLLRDLFTTALAAGSVNGTSPEPGPGGPRTVVDTNNKLSITGGVASFATGGVTSGDPGLWYASQARVFGKALLVNLTNIAATGRASAGWDSAQAGQILNGFRLNGASLTAIVDSVSIAVEAITVTGVAYNLCLVMRGAGHYYFIKGGAFTNWTLVWVGGTNAAAGFPAVGYFNGTDGVFTADNLRVPIPLYSVPVLAYDTFTRADGALGSTETTGPDGQAVTARAWTGATWAIATNKAVNTPTLGADVIVNGAFTTDTDWTKGTGWTIAAGVATQAGGVAAAITQAVGVLGLWYQSEFTLSAYVAGTLRSRFGSGFTGVARSANATYTDTGRCSGSTGLGITSDTLGAGAIDNVSFKLLTTSELLASLQVSTADVLADVNVTGPTATAGIQAGLVCNLDSAATPANFVVAYLNGNGSANLDKCVAGVYTNVISAAVTYAAGATLRVIKSGTSYLLFYNGAAVGTVQTISDAGIINNTLHGTFSTSPINSVDNFQVIARGTGNEFSGLDSY